MESLSEKTCNHQSPIIDGQVWHCKIYGAHSGVHHCAGREWLSNSTIIPISLDLIDNSVNFSRSTPIDTENECFKALTKSIKEDGFRGCVQIERQRCVVCGDILAHWMGLEHFHCVIDKTHHTAKFPYRSVAGHTRIEAARAAGLTEIPCEILSTKSQTEADILTLLENLLRRDPTPADYATAFHILRDRLVTEKGMRAKSAIAYLADRCGISVQRVEALIRIKENLIPELFRAFEGVGGLPLTVTEASCYAGQSQDEQREVYLAWRAVGGRKTPRAEPLEDNRPVQPRQSVSRIREAIAHYQARVTEAEFKWGESFAADVAIINVLKWVLSTRKDLP